MSLLSSQSLSSFSFLNLVDGWLDPIVGFAQIHHLLRENNYGDDDDDCGDDNDGDGGDDNDDHGGDEDLIDEPSTVIGETKLTELPFPGNIIIFVVIQVGRL